MDGDIDYSALYNSASPDIQRQLDQPTPMIDPKDIPADSVPITIHPSGGTEDTGQVSGAGGTGESQDSLDYSGLYAMQAQASAAPMDSASDKAFAIASDPNYMPGQGVPTPSGASQEQIQQTQDQQAVDLTQVLQDKVDSNGQPLYPDVSVDLSSRHDIYPSFLVGRQIGLGEQATAGMEFQRLYPQGSMERFKGNDGEDYYIARTAPGQPFKYFDPNGFSWGKQLNLPNAANIGALAVAPEVSLIKQGANALAGTMIGMAGELLANKLRFNPPGSDPTSMIAKSWHTAAEADLPIFAVGATQEGSNIGRKALNTAAQWTQKALERWGDKDAIQLSQEAASKLGVPELSLGQYGPEIAKVALNRAAGTSATAQDSLRSQQQSLIDSLQNLQERGKGGLPTSALQTLVKNQEQQLALIPLVGKSATRIELQGALDSYDTNAKDLIRRKFDDAAKQAGVLELTFPMDYLKAAKQDIDIGVRGPAIKGGTTPITGPSPKLKDEFDAIDRLAKNLGNVTYKGKSFTSVDQLMALRNSLFDKMNNPAFDPETQKQAYKLWDATHRMMEMASSDTASGIGMPRMGTARINADAAMAPLRDALNEYKSYEATKELLGNYGTERSPRDVAARLIQPGNAQQLNSIKSTLVGTSNEPGWTALQNGFRSSLQTDLAGAEAKITKLQLQDKQVIDTVMSPEEQESWKKASQLKQFMDQSQTVATAAGRRSPIENAQILAQTASRDDILKFAKTPNSVYAQGIKSGMWANILKDSKVVDQRTGQETLDPGKLVKAIEPYLIGDRRAALKSVLNPSDIELLSLMHRYATSINQSVGSMGGSLSGASIAGKFTLKHALDPRGVALGALDLFNNTMTGTILSTPRGQSMVRLAMKSTDPNSFFAWMGKAAGLTLQSQVREQQELPHAP